MWTYSCSSALQMFDVDSIYNRRVFIWPAYPVYVRNVKLHRLLLPHTPLELQVIRLQYMCRCFE